MTTMAIVLVTVFVLGGTTEMALNYLNIGVGVDEDTYMRETLREPVLSSFLSKFGKWPRYLSYVSCCFVIFDREQLY